MLTTPETSEAEHRSEATPLGVVWEPLFRSAASWNGNLAAVCGDLSTEYLDFLRRRGAEDIAFPFRLMSCKTPVDLMQAYQRFFEKASRDYQAEYAALARIGRKLVNVESADRQPD
jgi:hypothetical protein